MKETTINDIYAGKPDAKDEVSFDGGSQFIDSFIVSADVNVDELLYGTFCFVSGFKGTGKTALLYYLESIVRNSDEQACSSFMFFKNDYNGSQREELEEMSKRLISNISIQDDVVIHGTEFECIWRWIFYQKIYDDNIRFNNGLFEEDENWIQFEEKLLKAIDINKKTKLSIPQKLTLACPVTVSSVTATPSVIVDFSSENLLSTQAYRYFMGLIEELDYIFKTLKRTDIPYYIFVDELEAYYGDKDVFHRDLRLIRDLIFTVKNLNMTMETCLSKNTKIICSIRTEIINSIQRFIIPKEINKVVSGFEVPLKWNYTNTNSFSHPILLILLKRIELAEKANGLLMDNKELSIKWFPDNIQNTHPANYILNNTWFKPRDIVRLISSAKQSLAKNDKSFKQSTFSSIQKNYSIESLAEVKEEMRALYTTSEIDCIITFFNGFKPYFTIKQLKERIDNYYVGTIMDIQMSQVLNDLYRLGFIGNYKHNNKQKSKIYRWQYRDDLSLIIDDSWSIIIHPALRNALSITAKYSYNKSVSESSVFAEGNNYTNDSLQDEILKNINENDIVEVSVLKITKCRVFGEFKHGNIRCKCSMNLIENKKSFHGNIHRYLSQNKVFKARIAKFNDSFGSWDVNMSLQNHDVEEKIQSNRKLEYRVGDLL